MILIALMWAQIPLAPDNFQRVVKYQTLKTSFYCDFESVANIVFSFETNFGRDLFKVIRLQQELRAFNAFRALLINSHLHALQQN